MLDVSSTFEKNRQVSVNYENRVFSGNEVQVQLDYSSQNQIVPIFQGASEFKLIGGNETGLRTAVTKSVFSVPDWLSITGSFNNATQISTNSPTSLITGSNALKFLNSPDNSLITTKITFPTSSATSGFASMIVSGSLLGLIHGYNYAVKNQIVGRFSQNESNPSIYNARPGIPSTSSVDPNDLNNYFKINYFSSSLASYENPNLPFLVERGDEIRVIYNISTPQTPVYITQDFTVLSIEVASFPVINPYNARIISSSGAFISTPAIVNGVYDTLIVYPNPSTLQNKIPDGTILNYTIRRKADNDQSVIVFQSAPPNDQGYQTLSGPGYLIPNDFTEIQTRNALTLINNLKAKNAFRDDNDTSISILTP